MCMKSKEFRKQTHIYIKKNIQNWVCFCFPGLVVSDRHQGFSFEGPFAPMEAWEKWSRCSAITFLGTPGLVLRGPGPGLQASAVW